MNSISLNTRQVGYIVLIVAVVLAVIVFQYTSAIEARNAILHQGCNLPASVCPYTGTPIESVLGGIVVAFLFVLGAFLIYTYKDTEAVLKDKNEKLVKISDTLEGDERKVYDAIVESEGAVYQHDLVTKTGMSKVKITRILDFLEARGLVERKRRGMSNLVVLKHI